MTSKNIKSTRIIVDDKPKIQELNEKITLLESEKKSLIKFNSDQLELIEQLQKNKTFSKTLNCENIALNSTISKQCATIKTLEGKIKELEKRVKQIRDFERENTELERDVRVAESLLAYNDKDYAKSLFLYKAIIAGITTINLLSFLYQTLIK